MDGVMISIAQERLPIPALFTFCVFALCNSSPAVATDVQKAIACTQAALFTFLPFYLFTFKNHRSPFICGPSPFWEDPEGLWTGFCTYGHN